MGEEGSEDIGLLHHAGDGVRQDQIGVSEDCAGVWSVTIWSIGSAPETYDHIKKHEVRWFGIGEVFNHESIPRKVRVENEI